MIIYPQNSTLPDLGVTWNASTGTPFDFSTGWTLSCNINGMNGYTGVPLSFTKTTGITALPGGVSPNVTLQWATSGEITTLQPGVYNFQLKAVNNTTSKQRYLWDTLLIQPVTF